MRQLLPVLLFLLGLIGPAGAEDFQVPGLDRDSTAYAAALHARSPAGLTPQAARLAEQRAADAGRRNDWPGVAAALEARLAGTDAKSEMWLALARAQLRRVPPDAPRAAQAAWQAFKSAEAGAGEIPSLLVIAEAMRVADHPEVSIQALEAVLERAPDDAGYKRQLADARRAAGIQVRRVRTEAEADPPTACIEFTTAPVRRSDFVPADWLRLEPAQPGAAVTREGDAICIAGLSLGATTQVTLRAGMPGEDGLALNKDAVLQVVMPNRQPRIIFDSRLFLLPRGQAPRVSLATVNLAAVKLRVLRLAERNLVPWTRETTPGEAVEPYNFTSQEENGKIVWEGRADIPHQQVNQVVRTALPLPDVFTDAGAYLVQATPGDGAPDGSEGAVQVVIRTDLAPTVWRGTDGLTVQVRSFGDALPRAGVALSLLARSNDVLAVATTDAQGVARFAAPLLRGTGPQAPQALHGVLGDDFVALDLTSAAFDLSDRGVEGAPDPGPLDAFAWTDRGIYRPGETVQLMALLRDAAGEPADVPAHVRVKRPNGQTFLDTVPPRGADAAVHLPVTLSSSAPAGTWTVELLADPALPPIGTTSFRVDAFVPDRMAVEVAPAGDIVPGQAYPLPVTARFLYGAPAAGLTGKATMRLVADSTPPAALAGYQIGVDGEEFAPESQDIEMADTDAQGHSTLQILVKTAPDSTRPVRAEVDVSVDDPSGRAAHAHASIPLRAAGTLIGIKPGFDGSVDADTEAGFDVAAVSPAGQRVAVPARLRLVRERPDWRMVIHGSLARYEIVYKDEVIEASDMTVPASGTLHYAKRLPFGRYRLEVAERAGLAMSSVRFRSGWLASNSPDTPDKVDVSTDKHSYPAGGSARVHVVSPFAGHATVLMATNRVHDMRQVDIAAGGTDLDVPVDAAWGPGAYVTVHVFRGGDGSRPTRAIGLAWIGIDPAARTLPLAIAAPDKTLPRARATVPVTTAPGAWVSVAAVDEGILRLTGFTSPDPVAHFLGRRRLGLDIRDDWGRLIPPAEGDATVLHQGGDEGNSALPEIPQKIVALFTPPVQAGADGVAQVSLDLPDFNGQVRLMAVAWQGSKIGSAAVDMYVRDPLIAEPLLPRFLAPGDEARMAVLFNNLDLPAGEAAAAISVEGPLALVGDARLSATLAPGAQAVRNVVIRGTGAGRGVIHLAVTGPGGFTLQREVAILVRPARPLLTVVAGGPLAPGAELRVTPALDRMVPGTGRAQVSFGGPVRYDPAALVKALDAYPLMCLEQASSKGLPLAVLPDASGGADRVERLQASIASVLDRQRYDGGFGLWSASDKAEDWLSAYALEFLLRARTAGATVPDSAIADAQKFMADAVGQDASSPEELAAQAYRLYVMALSGQPRAGANRVLAEKLANLPTPLARAQLGAALALSNDRPRAEAAFAAALDAPARTDWYDDRGSALRDQAATAVLLKESGLLPDRLPALLAAMPGADLKPELLSTQEQAWAAAAAGVLGRDGRPARVSVDGTALTPAATVSAVLAGPAVLRNLDDRAVWQSVSTTGVPVDPQPAARAGMRVSRRFFTSAGDTLDLDTLRQNTVFVLLIEGRADDGQDHHAQLIQGLPAGWEIVGRLPAGKVPGMSWLGELSETDAEPAADDRYAAVLPLTSDAPSFRLAVRLRAVTPGSFEIPGAMLSDMYRPGVFARQNSARIKVQAAE